MDKQDTKPLILPGFHWWGGKGHRRPPPPSLQSKESLTGRLLKTVAAEMQLHNIRDGKMLSDPTYSSKGRPDAGISPFALEKLPRNHSPRTGGVHGLPLHPSGCVIH